MALVLNDRVKETTTTTSTGDISLAGAVSGFETFVSGIGNSNTTYYCIAHKTLNEFEIGIGTINDLSTDTISGRSNSNVLSSSNSDNVVDFSAGEKSVFCTLPASKAMYKDSSGNPVGLGSYLQNISEDSSPQLGAALDAQTNNITNLGTINTHTIPAGTGTFALTSNIPTNNNSLTNGAGYLTAHPNISAASSSDNSGQTFIQDITVDSNGHITAIGTATSSGGVSEALAIAYATAL